MRIFALATLALSVVACRDTVSAGVNDDPHPGSAITATVGPDGGIVRTPNGYAAVKIPAGALSGDVLVRLERVNAKYPPGRGPLLTNHVQYGAAYQVTMTPAPVLSRSFSVALCAGEGQPFQGPDEIHHRLKYAVSHLGGGQGGESLVFPSGGTLGIVNCAPRSAANPGILGRLFAAIGPKLAYAIDLGGGGEGWGDCTHTPCSIARTPFQGLIIGVMDPGAIAQ